VQGESGIPSLMRVLFWRFPGGIDDGARQGRERTASGPKGCDKVCEDEDEILKLEEGNKRVPGWFEGIIVDGDGMGGTGGQ
jgi:hypothetical protein